MRLHAGKGADEVQKDDVKKADYERGRSAPTAGTAACLISKKSAQFNWGYDGFFVPPS